MIPREKKGGPYSYEVLDEVLERGEAQELARRRNCTPQFIRSMCRAPETDGEYKNANVNDLDRIRLWIAIVKENDGSPDRAYPIAQYIARQCFGTFVPDISVPDVTDVDVMAQLSSTLKEASEAVEEANKAYFVETPGKITSREQQRCNKSIDEALVALLQLRNLLAIKVR